MEIKKNTLSVVMAIHNEEDVIEACMRSIYDICDEIIVVDGESTDKTLEKIKLLDSKKKVRIISVPNEKNFHLMKQVAIGASSCQWTYQIDADEQFSPELQNEISEIVSSESDDIIAYWSPRLNYFLGQPLRKGGQYPDPTLRLYLTGHGYLPAKNVHEQTQVTFQKMKLGHGKYIALENEEILPTNSSKIKTLKHNLLHFPYRSFQMYLDKWVRYNKLEAGRIDHKPSILSYLIWKPAHWFFLTYLRHKGFVDGFAGFVFSFFSAIRFWGIWWEYQRREVIN